LIMLPRPLAPLAFSLAIAWLTTMELLIKLIVAAPTPQRLVLILIDAKLVPVLRPK